MLGRDGSDLIWWLAQLKFWRCGRRRVKVEEAATSPNVAIEADIRPNLSSKDAPQSPTLDSGHKMSSIMTTLVWSLKYSNQDCKPIISEFIAQTGQRCSEVRNMVILTLMHKRELLIQVSSCVYPKIVIGTIYRHASVLSIPATSSLFFLLLGSLDELVADVLPLTLPFD